MSSLVKPESREARNTVFTVLSNHRRRYVLYACNQADGEISLSDVAEQVAAWEYDKPIEAVTSAERKRIYTSIQQHHLSKLTEAGLLEVDGDRLATTEKARNLDVYLEVVPGQNIPWATYYFGLAVVGAASLLLARLGWFPDPVSAQLVAWLLVGAFGVSGLVHTVQSRRMKFDSIDMPPEIDE